MNYPAAELRGILLIKWSYDFFSNLEQTGLITMAGLSAKRQMENIHGDKGSPNCKVV